MIRILLLILLSSSLVCRASIEGLKGLYNQTLPAIAYIRSIEEEKGQRVLSYGTGFFLEGGYLVSNAHVLLNKNVEVFDSEGKAISFSNKFIIDTDNDLVIVQTSYKGKGLQLAKNNIEVSDEVFIISNSANFKNSLSLGIISGIRDLQGKEKIQFTAPIAQGSSGAPILNQEGQVVGIVNGIWKGDNAQNINFGIPSKFVLKEIEKK